MIFEKNLNINLFYLTKNIFWISYLNILKMIQNKEKKNEL